jgi:hypothetical protein
MKLKENLEMSTDDFFYDLFDGGYIDPEKILKNRSDIEEVENAIAIIKDFRDSCEKQIEDFYSR